MLNGMLTPKELEYEEYLITGRCREEYQLEFMILRGQIMAAFAQQIQAETGEVMIW